MVERVVTSYSESLQDMVGRYRMAGQAWPATARQIARWAVRNKLWAPQDKDLIGQLARDLSRAMREEYYTDPKGRRVRAKHAARRKEDDALKGEEGTAKEQKTFWADIRTDEPEHIELALQQRRTGIVGDCKQLKTDADSFNDFHPSGRQIMIVFNFDDDLAEMDQPTEYHPPSPED